MRRIDWILLIIAGLLLTSWMVVAGKDGYKGSNAVIVARSIALTATIDGQIENEPPEVGSRITPSDVLVRIRNSRLDQSRLTDFESEVFFLERQVESLQNNRSQITDLLTDHTRKAREHSRWMLRDVEMRSEETQKQLEIARSVKFVKVKLAERTAELYSSSYASDFTMTAAQSEAEIATRKVELGEAQLSRDMLLLKSISRNGAFFNNGDASYWDRMIDSLKLREMENNLELTRLSAQLIRVRDQAEAERVRVESSIEEEHRVPFAGQINANYVSKGTRVTAGTNLMQILDCANPIAIVPIPEHRIAEFSVGTNATVYPIDTNQELQGTISYVTSGPLIGHDDTIYVQEDMTTTGLRAVITFNDRQAYLDPSQPCESTHQAVVVIHTQSKFVKSRSWLASRF